MPVIYISKYTDLNKQICETLTNQSISWELRQLLVTHLFINYIKQKTYYSDEFLNYGYYAILEYELNKIEKNMVPPYSVNEICFVVNKKDKELIQFLIDKHSNKLPEDATTSINSTLMF